MSDSYSCQCHNRSNYSTIFYKSWYNKSRPFHNFIFFTFLFERIDPKRNRRRKKKKNVHNFHHRFLKTIDFNKERSVKMLKNIVFNISIYTLREIYRNLSTGKNIEYGTVLFVAIFNERNMQTIDSFRLVINTSPICKIRNFV